MTAAPPHFPTEPPESGGRSTAWGLHGCTLFPLSADLEVRLQTRRLTMRALVILTVCLCAKLFHDMQLQVI